MTDNEIIKALEICADDKKPCDGCVFHEDDFCGTDLEKAALDLIKRQQERIERLKDNLDAVLAERADHSEAIKEFAERLNEKAFHDMNDGEAIGNIARVDF